AKMQSIASQERKVKQSNEFDDVKIGKKPDTIIKIFFNDQMFEIGYMECSKIQCTSEKETEDSVKLWRGLNDGMSWV
ncbi:16182_t:CDS:1, partial [Dentiscutata erythropus]